MAKIVADRKEIPVVFLVRTMKELADLILTGTSYQVFLVYKERLVDIVSRDASKERVPA